MKKLTTIKILLVALVFSACNFNQSINKDLVTGASSRGDGLGCDDISIQIDGETVTRNTFTYGENVVFVFDGINGFKEENGKVYPEMSLVVIKKENQMVLSELNLLNLKEGTSLSPLQLQANLIANFPHKNNEEYEVQLTIWDTKGEGKFIYNMPFTIIENELLHVKSASVDYTAIYLWNESDNKVVADNKMTAKNKYLLMLEGLDGLKVENGKVFPALSIHLTDNKGNEILSNPNLLQSSTTNGVDAEAFTKNQTFVALKFNEGESLNPYKLTVELKDAKSENKLNITTELVIE